MIVTANGQTISEIDEILDFGGYYRIVRNGKKDLSFRRSEVQFQQNCLTDGKIKKHSNISRRLLQQLALRWKTASTF